VATDPYPYGPSRRFVWVVGAVVAAQVWLALPDAPRASDTAELERTVYAALQTHTAVSDVRCARTGREAANCVATLPDSTRERVRARIDANSGEIRSVVVDSVPPLRLAPTASRPPVRAACGSGRRARCR
jgi:hypothetical protein